MALNRRVPNTGGLTPPNLPRRRLQLRPGSAAGEERRRRGRVGSGRRVQDTDRPAGREVRHAGQPGLSPGVTAPVLFLFLLKDVNLGRYTGCPTLESRTWVYTPLTQPWTPVYRT